MNMQYQSNSPVNDKDELIDRGYIERDCPMETEPINSFDTSSTSNNSIMPSIPKPAQKLPPRCSSEPIDHRLTNIDAQVDALLEDWPRRTSDSDINTQDWTSLYKQLEHPRVTFSETSSMHVYHADPHYVRNKAYSRAERKSFSTEAMREAIRIKRLVLATPGDSTRDSFKYLLKNDIICLEEIVGIEHLVLGKSASKLLRERQDHAKAILMEQCRQRVVKDDASKVQDDTTKKLGEFSASRSCKSVKRARIRAAMAA